MNLKIKWIIGLLDVMFVRLYVLGIDLQMKLRDTATFLKERGVDVLLSNSSAGAVFELYEGFEIEEVYANRAINSKGSARGKVAEVLIR